MQLCICLDFFHNYLEICLFAQLENKQKVIINEILLRISVCIGKNHCINVLLLFSHPVMSDSLWPHGLQHARPLCPSPSPKVCPSSCPLHWSCHPAISSSDALFFCPQSFPASGIFFQWVSCSHKMTTVLEFQPQHQPLQWVFRVYYLKIDWFDLLAVQGTFRSLLQHHRLKASILRCSVFFTAQLSQLYMTAGKTINKPWLYKPLSGETLRLCFSMHCLGLS